MQKLKKLKTETEKRKEHSDYMRNWKRQWRIKNNIIPKYNIERDSLGRFMPSHNVPKEWKEESRKGRLGIPPTNKGIPMQIIKPGYIHPMQGLHWSPEKKKELSDAHIGQIPWNLGLTNADERVLKYSSKQKGRKLSEKHRANLLIAHNKEPTKQKHREARLKMVFPSKDSKPELKVQNQLKQLNILFEKHKPILGQPDVYIPKLNLCIFIDGCYWHACHECKIVVNKNTLTAIKAREVWYRDFEVKNNLELEGYNVIRLWEHDIVKSDFNILTILRKLGMIQWKKSRNSKRY